MSNDFDFADATSWTENVDAAAGESLNGDPQKVYEGLVRLGCLPTGQAVVYAAGVMYVMAKGQVPPPHVTVVVMEVLRGDQRVAVVNTSFDLAQLGPEYAGTRESLASTFAYIEDAHQQLITWRPGTNPRRDMN